MDEETEEYVRVKRKTLETILEELEEIRSRLAGTRGSGSPTKSASD